MNESASVVFILLVHVFLEIVLLPIYLEILNCLPSYFVSAVVDGLRLEVPIEHSVSAIRLHTTLRFRVLTSRLRYSILRSLIGSLPTAVPFLCALLFCRSVRGSPGRLS